MIYKPSGWLNINSFRSFDFDFVYGVTHLKALSRLINCFSVLQTEATITRNSNEGQIFLTKWWRKTCGSCITLSHVDNRIKWVGSHYSRRLQCPHLFFSLSLNFPVVTPRLLLVLGYLPRWGLSANLWRRASPNGPDIIAARKVSLVGSSNQRQVETVHLIFRTSSLIDGPYKMVHLTMGECKLRSTYSMPISRECHQAEGVSLQHQ